MALLMPVWPGWHTMPAPAAEPDVRWSAEAWEGAYGPPWGAHWKPWPWEAAFLSGYVMPLEPKPMAPGDVWQGILDLYMKLDEQRTLWPQPSWPDLRTYVCPGCMRSQYGPGYCDFCNPVWLKVQTAHVPYTLPVIIGPPSP